MNDCPIKVIRAATLIADLASLDDGPKAACRIEVVAIWMRCESAYGHHVLDILWKERRPRLRIKSRRIVKKSSNGAGSSCSLKPTPSTC